MQQSSSRASPSFCGERERCNGEREAPMQQGCGCPSSPPLYIGPLGWGAALEMDLQGGGGQGGNACPPRQVGRPLPYGFQVPTLGAGGRPMGGAPAHYGLVPSPLQPTGPSGMGGPTRWTPGTHLVVPVQYR